MINTGTMLPQHLYGVSPHRRSSAAIKQYFAGAWGSVGRLYRWSTNLTRRCPSGPSVERIVQGEVLVNSGLTIALVLGLSVLDMSQNAVANLGIDDLKLTHPVYVGDTLYAESVCTGLRPSSSRPGFGIVSMRTRGLNQHGDEILSWSRAAMLPDRDSGIGQDYFPVAKDGPLTP